MTYNVFSGTFNRIRRFVQSKGYGFDSLLRCGCVSTLDKLITPSSVNLALVSGR